MTPLLLAFLLAQGEPRPASDLDAKVDGAIKKGVEALRKAQREDGMWTYAPESYSLGMTGFAVYTLLKCDVPLDDRQVVRGLEHLLTKDPEHNYVAAASALALATAVEKIKEKKKGAENLGKLQAALQKMADVLVASQGPHGGWDYPAVKGGTGVQKPGAGSDKFDLSNTQFALLGLRAAANCGVRVPASTWERALKFYDKERKPDGGWPYAPKEPKRGGPDSTPSMTAGSVFGYFVCKTSLSENMKLDKVRAAPAIKEGLDFLVKKWSEHPHTRRNYYYLYSLERLCMVAKLDRIGESDWYVEGATWIVGQQDAEGRWKDVYGETGGTCLALLFLKRAFVRSPYIETESGSKPPKKK